MPKIVNNEQVQDIPENFLNMVNEKMKVYFSEVGEHFESLGSEDDD